MTEHSTPPRFDPIDGATVHQRRRKVNGGTLHTVAVISGNAPPAVREMVEDRIVAWEDRLAADIRAHDQAHRRRREAAILRKLNRPHRRVLRWLRSWRG